MKYGERLITKVQRLEVQNAEFERLLKRGHTREDYKNLIFWTKDEAQAIGGTKTAYSLRVFKVNAAHHLEYCFYRTDDNRAAKIATYKASQDRQQTYKEEQKASGKKLTRSATCAGIPQKK